jgi:hypothetical protein
MGLVIFFSVLVFSIFVLRFIVHFKGRSILSKIKEQQNNNELKSNTKISSGFPDKDLTNLQSDVTRLLRYQKVLNYIKLFTIIILVLVGILMATA